MLIPIKFGNDNQFSQAPRIVLAADVGATKTNMALIRFEDKNFSILKENKYKTKDFTDAGQMIREFLDGNKPPDLMSFGVAGPVQNGKVSITNLSWQIDSGEISKQNNNIPVYLVNDLEATAYGLAMLSKEDLHTLYEPKKKIEGNIALIAPGTGLGEAGLYWDGNFYHPFANEGGHCDFAPRSDLDMELHAHLHKKFGHVSWERVISGPGILSIYEFLRIKDRYVPAWLSEKMLAHNQAIVISDNAEEAAICKETMDIFLRYLATEAANLALKFKAMGGLLIGGGILPNILRLVNGDAFIRSFQDFGRMKVLLKDIPVKIIVNEKTALIGAACYGAFKEKS